MKLKSLAGLLLAVSCPILLSGFGKDQAETILPPTPVSDDANSATNTTVIRVHRVEQGEDLYVVAMMYGVSVAVLKEANGLTTVDLKPGQNLQIPMTDNPEPIPTNSHSIPPDPTAPRKHWLGCTRNR